jgi:pimeloyl-ACP methyl ester carboxylesterase
VIAQNDRAIPPQIEKAEAASIGATAIILPSGHLVMLTHPKEVADFIEQAAAKASTR